MARLAGASSRVSRWPTRSSRSPLAANASASNGTRRPSSSRTAPAPVVASNSCTDSLLPPRRTCQPAARSNVSRSTRPQHPQPAAGKASAAKSRPSSTPSTEADRPSRRARARAAAVSTSRRSRGRSRSSSDGAELGVPRGRPGPERVPQRGVRAGGEQHGAGAVQVRHHGAGVLAGRGQRGASGRRRAAPARRRAAPRRPASVLPLERAADAGLDGGGQAVPRIGQHARRRAPSPRSRAARPTTGSDGHQDDAARPRRCPGRRRSSPARWPGPARPLGTWSGAAQPALPALGVLDGQDHGPGPARAMTGRRAPHDGCSHRAFARQHPLRPRGCEPGRLDPPDRRRSVGVAAGAELGLPVRGGRAAPGLHGRDQAGLAGGRAPAGDRRVRRLLEPHVVRRPADLRALPATTTATRRTSSARRRSSRSRSSAGCCARPSQIPVHRESGDAAAAFTSAVAGDRGRQVPGDLPRGHA